jgi:hypothetical protein
MNDQPSAPEDGAGEAPVQRLLHSAEEFARRDPAKALAAAFGAGLLLNLVPSRVIVGTVTAVAVPFLRPALLSLGLLKAFELCCKEERPVHGAGESEE